MSLELVINEKTIKSRRALLSNYLKNNKIGILTEHEALHFKQIFGKFYIPDDKYIKFNINLISNVSIVNNRGNKCFHMCVDNIWYPASIDRLSGSNRTEKENLKRALRNAVEEQINNYRILHPLNINDTCPITNNKLGFDAEVDHQIPFHILAAEWIKDNKHIYYIYDLNKFEYILQEPHYTQWINFHLEKAILRWVSKEGNKIAHHLYSM